MNGLERLLWICLGGACGSGARFLLSSFAIQRLGLAFPYGTFAVNLIGSFALGALMSAGAPSISPGVRLALGTGVLGGFTTYSSFSYETLKYMQDGAYGMAALYGGGTFVACLASCALGAALGRALG